jgi:hypothetical protein
MTTPTKIPHDTPLAHSVEGASRRATCGRTSLYAAIKSGRLKARKIGRRTIILDEDLRGWLASLPMRQVAQ